MRLGSFGRRYLSTTFRSLRTRNYRLFWSSQLVSLTGTHMQDVALAWLVYEITDSPLATALTITIRFLPNLLLSLHGGVLADRLPKRRTLIVLQSIQLAFALSLAVLTSTGHITLAVIYTLTGLRGLVDAVGGPTRQSFVPEMVGVDDVSNAVALNSALFNSARLFGPAIGGIVIHALGTAACFYLNAGSFVAVIVGLLFMRREELYLVPRPPREKVGVQLREGLRYARATPEVLVVLMVVATVGTFGYNFPATIPIIAREMHSADPLLFGSFFSFLGAGSLLAGLVAASVRRLSQRLFFATAVVFVLLLGSIGFSRWVALTATLLFLAGFAGVLWMITANTRLQMKAPGHLRGRVMGIYMLLFAGTTPIGSYFFGQLAERVAGGGSAGTRITVFITAGLSVVGVIVGLIYARRRRGEGDGGVVSEEPQSTDQGE